MRSLSSALCLLLFTFAPAFAEKESSEIQLVDGGVVVGTIESVDDQAYVVISPTLGEIRVPRGQIKLIRTRAGSVDSAAAEPKQDAAPHAQELDRLRSQILSDESMVERITDLQSDPEIQQLLADPELMRAISAGNVAELMGNPKFLRLMENPRIQEMQRQILAPQP